MREITHPDGTAIRIDFGYRIADRIWRETQIDLIDTFTGNPRDNGDAVSSLGSPRFMTDCIRIVAGLSEEKADEILRGDFLKQCWAAFVGEWIAYFPEPASRELAGEMVKLATQTVPETMRTEIAREVEKTLSEAASRLTDQDSTESVASPESSDATPTDTPSTS
ncbi:MAG: hypothetical protein AAFQ71_11415 [Planctomycetota bacterium]